MSFTHPRKPSPARRVGVFLAAFGLLLAARPAAAQLPGSNLPVPRLYTVFPSGAKAGTTVDATFGGLDLDEPDGVVFSHPGIKAEPILAPAPKPDPKKPPAVGFNRKFGDNRNTPLKFEVVASPAAGAYDLKLNK